MGWFKRLWGKLSGKPPEAAPESAPEPVVAPPGATEPALEKATLPVAESVDEFKFSVEELADVDKLGNLPTPPDLGEQVELLSKMVLEHFRTNRPDPAAFPRLAIQIIDLIEHPDVDFNKLVSLIGQDAAVSASVLKAANSPLFRRSAEVHDIRSAVTQLGLDLVAQISAGVAGRALFDMEARSEYELFAPRWKSLFHHSMTTAFSSAWMALSRRGTGAAVDRSFAGGMFHDIGKSLALRSLGAIIITGKAPFAVAEEAIDKLLELVHVELGVEMHRAWSLPQHLTTICTRHHDAEIPEGPEFMDLHIVRIASGLNELRVNPSLHAPVADNVCQSLRTLKMDRFQLRALNTQIREFAGRVSLMFGLDGG